MSVSDNKEQVNYSLSPNPVQDILTINRSFGTTSKYEIFTLEGKKVLSGQLKGLTQKLDINALPRGAYLFVSGISSKKFMVQ